MRLLRRPRQAAARHVEADGAHRLLEQLPVFRDLDRLDLGANQLDVVLLENAEFVQIHGEVQRRLAADRREDRVRTFARDDRLEELGRQRLDVGPIRHLGVGHDRRRIAVDQDHFEPFGPQRLACLRTRVVELAGLADDDRTRADHQHTFQVGSSWHSWASRLSGSVDAVSSRHPFLLNHLDEVVEQVVRVVRAGRRLGVVLDREDRLGRVPQPLDRPVVEVAMRHFDVRGQRVGDRPRSRGSAR